MQYQKAAVVQRQELRMTPQLLQSIQLMALPLHELKLKIQERLEINPALEVVSEQQPESLDTEVHIADEEEYFAPAAGYEDGQQMFLEGMVAQPETLHEYLLWQLHLQHLSPKERLVGEMLINNINDDGFHSINPHDLIRPAMRFMLPKMLALIQNLDPMGTCTKNYHESLVVQAQQMASAPQGMVKIISEYFELFEHGKFSRIARELNMRVEEVKKAADVIRRMNPFPGRAFSTAQPKLVIPDLLLKRRGNQFILVLNNEEIPVLGIDSAFRQISNVSDKSTKKFVAQKIRDAQWFIQSLEQRNHTLYKVARTIIEYQNTFFLRGRKYLSPLTLKDIAEDVGVSESTVSRLTNGKYLQTQWGIYELKYFFSGEVSGVRSDGAQYSKNGVKEIIREILEADTGNKKKLSDQKISDLLAARNIRVARRTVAKYRTELKIYSSHERRTIGG